jgi:predicted oxidoreductase
VVQHEILVPREEEIRRIMVPAQPGQKVYKTPSQIIKAGHSYIHLILAIWEA